MKHQNKYWILPVLLMIFSIPGLSQQNIYKWRVGITTGLMNYKGDIETKYFPNSFDDPMFDKLSYSFEIERKLSKSFGLQASFLYGTLTANDIKYKSDGSVDVVNSNYDRALNFQSDIRGGSIRMIYHFDNNKIQSWNARLSPYLFAGFGITRFDVFADLMNKDGDFYYYWSDHTIRDLPESPGNASVSNIIEQDKQYETNLKNLGTENDIAIPDQTFNIPFGLGLKYRLSERFNLNLQFDAKYAFSDKIDDISGKYRTSYNSLFQEYAANPNGSTETYRGNSDGKNDIYFYGSIGLHINFGEKKKPFKVYPYYSDHGQVARVTELETTEKKIIFRGDSNEIQEFKISPEDTLTMHKVGGGFESVDTLDGMIIKKVIRIEKDSLAGDTSGTKKIVIRKKIQNGDSLIVEERVMFIPGDSTISDSTMMWFTDSGDSLDISDIEIEMESVHEEVETNMVIEKKISIGTRDSLVVIKFNGMEEGELEIDPMIFRQSTLMSDTIADMRMKLDQLRMEMDLLKLGMIEDTSKGKKIIPPSSLRDSVLVKKTISTTRDTILKSKVAPDNLQKPKSVIQRDTSLINDNTRIRKQLDELRQKNTELEKRVSTSPVSVRRDTVVVIKEVPMPMDRKTADEALQNRISIQDDRIRSLEGEIRNVRQSQNQIPVQPNINITPQSNNAEQERLRKQVDDLNAELALLKTVNADTATKDSIRLTATGDTIRVIKSIPVYQELVKAEKLKELEMRSALQQTRIDSLQNVVRKEKELSLKGTTTKDSVAIANLKTELQDLKEQLKKSQEKKPDVKPQELSQKNSGSEIEKVVIYFASNSSKVISKYYPELDRISTEWKKDRTMNIVLSAFTDASGDPGYNKQLSDRRANAVRSILISKGIEAGMVHIKALGEKDAEEQHDPNSRRVEIKFTQIIE